MVSEQKADSAGQTSSAANHFKAFGSYLDKKGDSKNDPEINDKFFEEWEETRLLGKGAHGICHLVKNKKNQLFYACKTIKTHDPEIIKSVNTKNLNF
jgi:hypothetical protein